MSSGAGNAPAPITLDEVARLIKLLGMLGSSADGEALNAARLAVKWLREHDTDWETLLVPDVESGVAAVSVGDAKTLESAAYKRGFEEGVFEGLRCAKSNYAPGSTGNFGTWPPPPPPPPPMRPPRQSASFYGAGTWQHVAATILDQYDDGSLPPGVLRGTRELSFVQDILARGFPSLTAAQETWFRDIAGRAGLSW